MTIEELKAELSRAEGEQQRLGHYIAALRRAIELHPLTSRDHNGRIGHKMEARTATREHSPGRRGPTIQSDGPFSIAADNSGQSIRHIAKTIGISYGAAKMANARNRGTDAIREALAKPPYLVPAVAWRNK